MNRQKIIVSLLLLAMTWGLGSPAALAQQEPGPSTPGAIPDPSTYQGSMEIQRQQDVQDQQFRQQQDQQSQQFQQRQNQQGQPLAGQPAGPSARQIWEKRPLVPPDHNALLGRWTTHAADTVGPKDSPLGDIGSVFGADVAKMAAGMLQGVCDSMFGNGIVDFRAATLVSIGRDGREHVLTRVEYRGGGDRIAVLTLDPINAALRNGGLQASPGDSPMKTWHDACAANSPACVQGRQALVADTAAATTMDAGGKGQSQPVPAGRYYVLGSVYVAGRAMIWNMPIELRAGINSVTLDMNNLTPVQ